MNIIYPFPVLHEKSLDYKDPFGYSSSIFRPSQNEIHIHHQLNRNTLVFDFILKNKASFFSNIVVEQTVFRVTKKADNKDYYNINNKLETKQKITIPEFNFSRLVIHIKTGVALMEDQNIPAKDAQGISEFWDGRDITFPAHSCIALQDWKHSVTMNSLFHTQSDPNFKEGTFETSYFNDCGSIKISIKMHTKLYNEVAKDKSHGKIRSHVLCSALTQVFQKLYQIKQLQDNGSERELDSVDDESLVLAEPLKMYLDDKGIPTWEDDSFDPSRAASSLYSVIIDDD